MIASAIEEMVGFELTMTATITSEALDGCAGFIKREMAHARMCKGAVRLNGS
jgi:hypothetical protein